METLEGKARSLLLSGVPVSFPYKPYPSQLAYMSRVVATLNASQAGAPANALLEAPTGSGKTLSLLCAALAWQKHFKKRLPDTAKEADGGADPLLLGGGFIVEDDIEDAPVEEEGGAHRPPKRRKQQRGDGVGVKGPQTPSAPRIYYGTRTHSQITQVVRELRKTEYKVSMAVLGSRKHYCTNKVVARKASVDEECKSLLRDPNKACGHYLNVQKLRGHESLQAGGALGVHDIEDLVGLGHSVRACAYFTSRLLAQDASIVFCPYIYLLDPMIRQSMDIDLRGSVLILDEAHNIEDVAREAASFTLELDALQAIMLEVEELMSAEVPLDVYQPIQDVMQELLAWLQQRSSTLQIDSQGNHHRVFAGGEILHELGTAGISLETFSILSDCVRKAVKAATDAEPDTPHLSGRAGVVLSGLFSALGYMLAAGGSRVGDYRAVVRRSARDPEGAKVAASEWVCSLSLWCLNPAVAFADLAAAARAIILTSGTLSPMSSFASELGVDFRTRMEGSHVVNVEKQVWAAVISRGPSDAVLNAGYSTSSSPLFQDELGLSLLACCRIVPHGALAFFPSYKLLERLCARWKRTGLWDRLSAVKDVFVEVRGPEDELDGMLARFYRAVKRSASGPGPGPAPPKKGRNARAGPPAAGAAQRREQPRESRKSGALLLAVCRGKVSEGIDFADAYARAVILVGIPYPNVTDLQVKLKKQYNDENCAERGLVQGHEWYRQQAFRALNQAAGRCIRHRNDFGAIILLDERFGSASRHLSKWLRSSVRPPAPFEQSMQEMAAFFASLRVSPPGSGKALPEQGLTPSLIPKLFPIFKVPASSPLHGSTCPPGTGHGNATCSNSFSSQTAAGIRTPAPPQASAGREPPPGSTSGRVCTPLRTPLKDIKNLPQGVKAAATGSFSCQPARPPRRSLPGCCPSISSSPAGHTGSGQSLAGTPPGLGVSRDGHEGPDPPDSVPCRISGPTGPTLSGHGTEGRGCSSHRAGPGCHHAAWQLSDWESSCSPQLLPRPQGAAAAGPGWHVGGRPGGAAARAAAPPAARPVPAAEQPPQPGLARVGRSFPGGEHVAHARGWHESLLQSRRSSCPSEKGAARQCADAWEGGTDGGRENSVQLTSGGAAFAPPAHLVAAAAQLGSESRPSPSPGRCRPEPCTAVGTCGAVQSGAAAVVPSTSRRNPCSQLYQPGLSLSARWPNVQPGSASMSSAEVRSRAAPQEEPGGQALLACQPVLPGMDDLLEACEDDDEWPGSLSRWDGVVSA